MLQEAQSPTETLSSSGNIPLIQTTLYDVIEAVNETLITGDDHVVAEIVMDLLNSCRARFQHI